MSTKLVYSIILLLLSSSLFGQADFPYSVSIEPYLIEDLDGVHSYAYGQHEGKWVIIGGRLDGVHARQPFNAFPASQNNTNIQVVDPEAGTVWAASLNVLPNGLKEQLQSTNTQFFQDGGQLVIIGGYAYSSVLDDHVTFPYLTVVDVPELINDIINGEDIAENFQQIMHDNFAVTGGQLGKIGEEFYLVGGQQFDGRYNPMDMPTFTQEYTDAIRKFTLQTDNGNLSFDNYTIISDPVHLHRRDYNLLPQIFPDGKFGYSICSGVFQINENLPFLYPVNITADGHEAITSFNQYLSNYHSAKSALYDAGTNSMHNLFFGGISQYYFEGENMVQDDDVPFVKTISRMSRNAEGMLEEVRIPIEMPGYLGAGAELILNENLPQVAHEIIDLSAISSDSFLLGYILGGINSQTLNPFTFNNDEVTSAATTLFKVYLKKTGTTPVKESKLPGYHNFEISVSPNPIDSTVFQLNVNAPEAGGIEIYMTDTTGTLIMNVQLEGLQSGKNSIEITLDNPVKGMAFLTTMLNGKYTASTKLVFK